MGVIQKSILLSVLFFLSACISSTNRGINQNIESESENYNLDTTVFDVSKKQLYNESTKKHILKKNSITFFILSNTEINELYEQTSEYTKYDFMQLFTNFKTLANSTRSRLSSKPIKVDISSAGIFIMQNGHDGKLVLDRIKEGQIMGQIFFDGEKTRIEYGILKNSELDEMITEFFKISNF